MNYFELYELTSGRARKLPPQSWSCDCRTPWKSGQQQFSGRMFPTEVDKEGICTECGYYAYLIDNVTLSLAKQRSKLKNMRKV